jgi:hypothetical protein
VLRFSHRLSAVLLALALAVGQTGVCAAGMPTPEARMACCTDNAPCPMHGGDDGGSTRVVTQAEADRCCAASERDDPAPSPATVAFSVPLSVIAGAVPALLPELPRQPHAWRTVMPPAPAHVPKHVLLSVFLV